MHSELWLVKEAQTCKHKITFFTIVWPCIVTDYLWTKPTDALNFNFIGITTLHVSGSLSVHHQEFLAVHRHWYILCSFNARRRTTPGSNRSSNLHKIYQCLCTAKNSWWWAERLPETNRVIIPIKLEFSASLGFIHMLHEDVVTVHRKFRELPHPPFHNA